MLLSCLNRDTYFHERKWSLALAHYLESIWLAMVAQSQSELPYLFERNIHLAKKKCIALILNSTSKKIDARAQKLFFWGMQLNLLRYSLDDIYLVQLSFSYFSEVYQNILLYLKAKKKEERQFFFNQYEEAFLNFESFYHQVLTTTSKNIFPWYAWICHLKNWMKIVYSDFFSSSSEDDSILISGFITKKWFSWRFLTSQSFSLFSKSIYHCLSPLSLALSELENSHRSKTMNLDSIQQVLKIYLDRNYPEWVFQRRLKPVFKSSWRYFMLEIDQYLDSTLLLFFNMKKIDCFPKEELDQIQLFFKTEIKLFEVLLEALKEHRLPELSFDFENDFLNFQKIIFSKENQTLTNVGEESTFSDEMIIYFILEKHRSSILNLLHAFPVEGLDEK